MLPAKPCMQISTGASDAGVTAGSWTSPVSRMWVLRPEVSMNDEANVAVVEAVVAVAVAVAVVVAVAVAIVAGFAAVIRREKAAADRVAAAATRHVLAHLIETY